MNRKQIVEFCNEKMDEINDELEKHHKESMDHNVLSGKFTVWSWVEGLVRNMSKDGEIIDVYSNSGDYKGD